MKFKEAEKKIKEFIEAIKDTDIEEIEYSSGGISVGITKKPGETRPEKQDAEETVPEKKPGRKKKLVSVFSHSVGVYRETVPPAKKVTVKTGQKVRKGEMLGAIESMKIMKEITSPVSGRIAEKLVKNNEPVQYGQKIFEIEESV